MRITPQGADVLLLEVERGAVNHHAVQAAMNFLTDAPAKVEFRLIARPEDETDEFWNRCRAKLYEKGPKRDPKDKYGWYEIVGPKDFFGLVTDQEYIDFEPAADVTTVSAKLGGQTFLLVNLEPDNGLIHSIPPTWRVDGAFMANDEQGYQSAAKVWHSRPRLCFDDDRCGFQCTVSLLRRTAIHTSQSRSTRKAGVNCMI